MIHYIVYSDTPIRADVISRHVHSHLVRFLKTILKFALVEQRCCGMAESCSCKLAEVVLSSLEFIKTNSAN